MRPGPRDDLVTLSFPIRTCVRRPITHLRYDSLASNIDRDFVRAQVQKLADGAKTAVQDHAQTVAKDDKKQTVAKDDKKKEQLETALQDHNEKKKKIEGLIAELEPELRKWEMRLADAKGQVEQVQNSRYALVFHELGQTRCGSKGLGLIRFDQRTFNRRAIGQATHLLCPYGVSSLLNATTEG